MTEVFSLPQRLSAEKIAERFQQAVEEMFPHKEIFRFANAPVKARHAGTKDKKAFIDELMGSFLERAGIDNELTSLEFSQETADDILTQSEHLTLLYDLEAPANKLVETFNDMMSSVTKRASIRAALLNYGYVPHENQSRETSRNGVPDRQIS